jgi:hypothetical protein
MDIHKPKPWRGLREFLKEYVIIVVGVLTALAAEQGAQWLHERHLSAEAREAVMAEINLDVTNLSQRLKNEPCVARKLDEIGVLLERAEAGASFAPAAKIGAPETRWVYTQRWEAATAGGRTSLLSSEEQLDFARVYYMLKLAAEEEDREQLPWSHLRALHGLRRLSPEMIYGVRMAASEARDLDSGVRANIAQAQFRAREIGVKGDAHLKMPPGYDPSATPPICQPLVALPLPGPARAR